MPDTITPPVVFDFTKVFPEEKAGTLAGSQEGIGEWTQELFGNFTTWLKELPTALSRDELTPASLRYLVRNRLKEVEYTQIRNITVTTVPGLNVTCLGHAELLSETVNTLETLSERILVPMEQYLGTLLNNSQLWTNRRPVDPKLTPHNISKVMTELEKQFRQGNVAVKRPFKAAFARNADVAETYTTNHDTISRLNAHSPRSMVKRIERLMGVTQALEDAVRDNPVMSDANRNMLVQAMQTSGEEIEFYSLVTYHLVRHNAALSAIDDELAMVLKR